MLKGHLQIELRNEKTGKVERHEQDNMVTSAVAKVLGLENCQNALAAATGSRNCYCDLLPVGEKALGGILLFDGVLEENADNIHFPMNVHLTGNAGRKQDSSGSRVGSLNELESGKTDTGYVNVWDFTTSQANGTIASLALTHGDGGYAPMLYTNRGYTSYANSAGAAPVAYDAQKGVLYLYSSGKIYSQKMYTDIIRASSPKLSELTEVFDFNFPKPGYSSWQIADGYDGYLYAIYFNASSTPATIPVQIRKVKISDFSFQEEQKLEVAIEDISARSTGSRYAWSSVFNGYCTVCKGYLYIVSYDYKKIYEINLSNVVDKKEFVFEDCMVEGICPKYNGGLAAIFKHQGMSSSGKKVDYYRTGLVYQDGEYREDEFSTTSTNCKYNAYYAGVEGDNLFVARGHNTINYSYDTSDTYFTYATNYLGTICNLSSPVTKTPEQTMKITYTLTDV